MEFFADEGDRPRWGRGWGIMLAEIVRELNRQKYFWRLFLQFVGLRDHFAHKKALQEVLEGPEYR